MFAAIERDTRQHRAAQHGDHGAAGRRLRLGAARKPRRALPLRLSGRSPAQAQRTMTTLAEAREIAASLAGTSPRDAADPLTA